MKSKKLLAAILAVAMIFGMMSFPAFAEEETSEGDSEVSAVAAGDTDGNEDPGVDEGDFDDPFGEEGDGDTIATELPEAVDGVITLTQDVMLETTFKVNDDLTIDLQGYTLSLKGGEDLGYKNPGFVVEVTKGELKIMNGTVKGADTINSAYAGSALRAGSGTALIVENAYIFGGSNQRRVPDEATANALVTKYCNGTGIAISAYYSSVTVIGSEVTGGHGVSLEGNYEGASYIASGSCLADGGKAIDFTGDISKDKLTIKDSCVFGGNSDLKDAGDAVYSQGNTIIENSTIKGGNCIKSAPSRGISGDAVYVTRGEVTITESNLEGGKAGNSWIGGAIEVSNGCSADIKVEDSTLKEGVGDSGVSYGAVKMPPAQGNGYSVTFKDVTLEANGRAVYSYPNYPKAINVEGSLTIKQDGENVAAESLSELLPNTTIKTDDENLEINGIPVTDIEIEDSPIVLTTLTVNAGDENAKYKEVKDALAVAAPYSTIKIVAVEGHEYENFHAKTEGIKFVGVPGENTRSAAKPVVKTNYNGSNTEKQYQSSDDVLMEAKNLSFDGIEFKSYSNDTVWSESAVGVQFARATDISGLSITNCAFTVAEGVEAPEWALMANTSSYTFANNTIVGYKNGICTMVDNGKLEDIKITDNEFEVEESVITSYWGIADGNGSVTFANNKITAAGEETPVVNFTDYANQRNLGSAISNISVSNNDGDAIYAVENINQNKTDISIPEDATLQYRYSKGAESWSNVPEDAVIYLSDEESGDWRAAKISDGKVVIAVATEIEVVFEQTDDETVGEDDEAVYDIVLKSKDFAINKFTVAEFDVAVEVEEGAVSYELYAAEDINVTNNGGRYEFNMNGIGAPEITAKEITIGQVKIKGYGKGTLNITDMVIRTTEVADSIVNTYTDVAGQLDFDIAAPTKKLTINIDFPNAVEDQDKAYQGMTVTIAGNDYSETISLGKDAVAMEDGKYTVEVENVLMKGRAYTVTVEGAGYRTARYTVTMNEDKTLNFWNNVKDVAVSVEQGKEGREVTKNFLAGDIVKDNNINIYDLSAVVSYFGAENLVEEHPEYARYDLNRDGKIDSKDVAYVLVSWGE